jgi:hypothetical protein
MHSLGSISAIASEKKIFLYFPDMRASGLIFSSETTWPNGTKLGSKHLCKVLYKVSPFRSVPPTNMAAKGKSTTDAK